MEEKGIGNLLYILISVGVVILSYVFDKRKRKNAPQVPQPQNEIPDWDPIPDDEPFFQKKMDVKPIVVESNFDSLETLESLETNKGTAFTEIKSNLKSTFGKKPIETIEDESNNPNKAYFDPVKAIIYSEIMKPKYF